MFDQILIIPEPSSPAAIRKIKTACFYSQRSVLLLPPRKNQHRMFEILDEVWFNPRLAEHCISRGLITSPDDAESYVDGLSNDDQDKLIATLDKSEPPELTEALRQLLVWQVILSRFAEDLDVLEHEQLVTFSLAADFRNAAELFTDSLMQRKDAAAAVFRSSRVTDIVAHWSSATPMGLPTIIKGLLLVAAHGEMLNLQEKDSAVLRRLNASTLNVFVNVVYALITLIACKTTNSIPVTGDAQLLKLLSLVTEAFGLESDNTKDRAMARTSEMIMQRALPSIDFMPMQELLRLRERVHPELERLWTEVRRLTWVTGTTDGFEDRQAREIIEAHVDPALAELKASILSARKESIRKLYNISPGVASAGTVFAISHYTGMTAMGPMLNMFGAFVGALLPNLPELLTQSKAKEVTQQSPYGVLLTLKNVNEDIERKRARDKERKRKRERKRRR